MGQISMDKIKKNTGNSAKSKELETIEQAEVKTESTELTDDTSEKAGAISETEPNAHAEKSEAEGKVIVTYIGKGIWRDANKELWASNDKSDTIVSERQYTIDEYERREDIKFMVGYGAMKVTYVK